MSLFCFYIVYHYFFVAGGVEQVVMDVDFSSGVDWFMASYWVDCCHEVTQMIDDWITFLVCDWFFWLFIHFFVVFGSLFDQLGFPFHLFQQLIFTIISICLI